MTIRTFIAAISAAGALASAPAIAQDQQAAQPQAQPITQEDVDMGVTILSAVNASFASENISQEVKNQLFLCLYNNKLSAVSNSVNEVISQNEDLTSEDPSHILSAVAAVCGIQAPEANAAPSAENR